MPSSRTRILVVDDDPFVTRGLARNLASIDPSLDITLKPGVAEALNALGRSAFDILVTDLRMPGIDGTALLEAVREQHPSTLRFVLSGEARESVMMQAARLSHQYLSKPCDTEQLYRVLMEALGNYRQIQKHIVATTLSRLADVPSKRVAFAELLRLLSNENVDLDSILAALVKDPGMTARVLRMANSPYYGHSGSVSSLNEAVELLGLEMIVAMTLSHKVFAYEHPRPESHLSVDELWSHCANVSALSRRLGAHLHMDAQAIRDTATAAMLHDIGRLVLAYADPYAYAASQLRAQTELIPAWRAEPTLFGNHHAEIGGSLLKLWGLPDSIARAVSFHHTPHLSGETKPGPATLLHLASFAADRLASPPQLTSLDKVHLETLRLPSSPDSWDQTLSDFK